MPLFSHKKFDSSDTSVAKFVFTAFDDSAVAEVVLYRYPDFKTRTVLCISTQSGCPVGCSFCGTGRFFARNLHADEIVEQIVTALSYVTCDPSDIGKLQIMFMSMGEPMLNLDALLDAIGIIHRRYPDAQLLVSTSAPRLSDEKYHELFHLAQVIPQIGVQFSVHESNDAARAALIPTKTTPLHDIGRLGEEFAELTGRQPFFNYCVHSGNDTQINVDELLANFDPAVWQATLSVICQKDETVKASTLRQLDRIEAFSQIMAQAGYSVRTFNPAGQDDIGGGCGQLWYFQEWANQRRRKQKDTVHCEAVIRGPRYDPLADDYYDFLPEPYIE